MASLKPLLPKIFLARSPSTNPTLLGSHILKIASDCDFSAGVIAHFEEEDDDLFEEVVASIKGDGAELPP